MHSGSKKRRQRGDKHLDDNKGYRRREICDDCYRGRREMQQSFGVSVTRPSRPCLQPARQSASLVLGNHRVNSRRAPVRVQALEWPDQELLDSVQEDFPDAGVADAEQARALFSTFGYTYLDVRPSLELEEVGKVKGSVNIPLVNASRKYSSEKQKKVLQKEDNPNFVQDVEKKFPDKENTKLLIGCSNGRKYSMDALMALDEAGYNNLVGLKGGYYAWNRKFDNKLGRRRFGEYQENYIHDGDSTGIHGSGAGFERVDAIEPWVPGDYDE